MSPAPRLLLAFPGGPSDEDPLCAALRPHWEAADLSVELVSVDPGSDDRSASATLEAAVGALGGAGPLVLGGFSRGARLAAQLAPFLRPEALICIGFPFHRRGAPGDRHGLEALRQLPPIPSLIVQGTRDPHGTRQDVAGYGPLPTCVQVRWLEDGNHRLEPRRRTGKTLDDSLRDVAGACRDFLAAALGGDPR